MTDKEKDLRKEAIKRLEEAKDVGEERWLVGQIRVPKTEIDILLGQLKAGEAYLKVPMALCFGNIFWRSLKASSNLRVNQEEPER